MKPPDPNNRQRAIRLLVASVAFILASAAMIVIVFRGYLKPAYEAWRQADPQQRSLLSASSTLLLAVVLVLVLLLLITAFGVRRFFHLGRHGPDRAKTHYVDAWSESARRMNTPARDIDESGEDREL